MVNFFIFFLSVYEHEPKLLNKYHLVTTVRASASYGSIQTMKLYMKCASVCNIFSRTIKLALKHKIKVRFLLTFKSELALRGSRLKHRKLEWALGRVHTFAYHKIGH